MDDAYEGGIDVSNRIAVNCQCGHTFRPPRQTQLKMAVTGAGLASGAAVGAAWGTTAGLAFGGGAIVATAPAGAAGGLILGLASKLGADWALAIVTCPRCGNQFRP